MKKLITVFFLGIIVQMHAQVDLDMGLQAFYPFFGNTLDASGNGYHGINYGASLTENRVGTPNTAYDFSGGDYFLDMGDVMDDVFAGIGNQFTLSAWIKPDTLMPNSIIIGKTADVACGEAQRQFFMRIFADQNLSFTFYSANTSFNARRVLSTSQLLDTHNWHHVLVMYDGTINSNNGKDRVTMYIKCTEEITTLETATGPLGHIQTGTSPVGIGNYITSQGGNSCDPERAFEGKIDDIRIYNRLLTEDEVSILCSKLPVSVENPVNVQEDFLLFPNPAESYFTVTNSALFSSYEVINLEGKIVLTGENLDHISVKNLPGGVYLVRLIDSENYAITKKVIITGFDAP